MQCKTFGARDCPTPQYYAYTPIPTEVLRPVNWCNAQSIAVANMVIARLSQKYGFSQIVNALVFCIEGEMGALDMLSALPATAAFSQTDLGGANRVPHRSDCPNCNRGSEILVGG